MNGAEINVYFTNIKVVSVLIILAAIKTSVNAMLQVSCLNLKHSLKMLHPKLQQVNFFYCFGQKWLL